MNISLFKVGDEVCVKNFRSHGPNRLSWIINYTMHWTSVSLNWITWSAFVEWRHHEQVYQKTIPNVTLTSPQVFVPDSDQVMKARAEDSTEQSESPPEQPSLQPLEESKVVRVPTQEEAVMPVSQDSSAIRRYPSQIQKPPDRFQF